MSESNEVISSGASVDGSSTSDAESTVTHQVATVLTDESAVVEAVEVPAGPADDAEPDDGGHDNDDGGHDNGDDDDDDDTGEGGEGAGPPDGVAKTGRGRRAQLEREGEVAADFLENLLDICDLDGDLDVDIDGDRASVSLVDSDEGRVPRRLVGTNGQVLEALQELTRLAVQSATGERSRLMLDVAGHRAQRRATLVEIAQVAIGKVKNGSAREPLEPMTAFERKVVHDEVLAAGLSSASEGVEPRRFVVILPA